MVGALDEARAHLDKAREFLQAAELTNETGLHNAATSSAVTSGINSKDAICLTLTGRTGKSDNHEEAVAELVKAGAAGQQLAPVFRRLLRLKPRSQYQSRPVSATDAGKAVEWATRLYEAARETVR